MYACFLKLSHEKEPRSSPLPIPHKSRSTPGRSTGRRRGGWGGNFGFLIFDVAPRSRDTLTRGFWTEEEIAHAKVAEVGQAGGAQKKGIKDAERDRQGRLLEVIFSRAQLVEFKFRFDSFWNACCKTDEFRSSLDLRNFGAEKSKVARAGIEPATRGFSVLCSTN